MAQLQAEEQVPESLIERALRIFGLPAMTRAIPEVESSAEPDSVRAGTPPASDHDRPEEVTDGKQHQSRDRAPVAG